jgi:SAM-dependent methyltransferase
VAAWTAEVLAQVERPSAIASACRGSASPAALAWLGECLTLGPDQVVVDVGGGLGGPAAWFADRFGVRPFLVEPMADALAGAGALFDLGGVVASVDELPFPDAVVERVLVLGVLDTLPDAGSALAELRRTMAREGRLGLLAYVADEAIDAADLPDGNTFPTPAQLLEDLDGCGFAVIDRVEAARLPEPPLDWRLRQERTATLLASQHTGDARLATADEQAGRFGALLERGAVHALLVHAVCV